MIASFPKSLLVLLAAAVAAASAPALGAPARAEAAWVINGKGFGHGVGMSQYGALGFAQNGRRYRPILRRYYRNTNVRRVASRGVRVLLGTQRRVRFTRARRACGRNLRPGRRYLFRGRNRVALLAPGGNRLRWCGRSGRANGNKPLRVFGHGGYRGSLIARATGSRLMVINGVALEGYVRGIVPNEMPASWHMQALRAQAVAARSYGIATSRSGAFDHYDDTRSQVYRGFGSETRRTNRATNQTRREVVKHSGNVAITYYSSTSGGRTENVEFGFPGASPSPYLKSVKDPFDDVSPVHSWRVTYSNAAMRSRLSGLFRGRLRRIRILRTGRSPRIVRARVVGSRGSSEVTGATLRSRLDLRSTWARFRRR